MKVSEINVKAPYDASARQMLEIAKKTQDDNVRVQDIDGDILAYHQASGELRLTSTGKLLARLSRYVSGFNYAEDTLAEVGLTAMHNALLRARMNNTVVVYEFDGYTLHLCRIC